MRIPAKLVATLGILGTLGTPGTLGSVALFGIPDAAASECFCDENKVPVYLFEDEDDGALGRTEFDRLGPTIRLPDEVRRVPVSPYAPSYFAPTDIASPSPQPNAVAPGS